MYVCCTGSSILQSRTNVSPIRCDQLDQLAQGHDGSVVCCLWSSHAGYSQPHRHPVQRNDSEWSPSQTGTKQGKTQCSAWLVYNYQHQMAISPFYFFSIFIIRCLVRMTVELCRIMKNKLTYYIPATYTYWSLMVICMLCNDYKFAYSFMLDIKCFCLDQLVHKMIPLFNPMLAVIVYFSIC